MRSHDGVLSRIITWSDLRLKRVTLIAVWKTDYNGGRVEKQRDQLGGYCKLLAIDDGAQIREVAAEMISDMLRIFTYFATLLSRKTINLYSH